MSLHFNAVDDSVVLLPTIVVTRGRCGNPHCPTAHGWRVDLAFLCFNLALEFNP